MDCEATLDQRFHHGAVRHFDGDVDLAEAGSAACRSSQAAISANFTAVLEDFLADLEARRPSEIGDGFRSPSTWGRHTIAVQSCLLPAASDGRCGQRDKQNGS